MVGVKWKLGERESVGQRDQGEGRIRGEGELVFRFGQRVRVIMRMLGGLVSVYQFIYYRLKFLFFLFIQLVGVQYYFRGQDRVISIQGFRGIEQKGVWQVIFLFRFIFWIFEFFWRFFWGQFLLFVGFEVQLKGERIRK